MGTRSHGPSALGILSLRLEDSRRRGWRELVRRCLGVRAGPAGGRDLSPRADHRGGDVMVLPSPVDWLAQAFDRGEGQPCGEASLRPGDGRDDSETGRGVLRDRLRRRVCPGDGSHPLGGSARGCEDRRASGVAPDAPRRLSRGPVARSALRLRAHTGEVVRHRARRAGPSPRSGSRARRGPSRRLGHGGTGEAGAGLGLRVLRSGRRLRGRALASWRVRSKMEVAPER